MPHNINRKPVYPEQGKPNERKAKSKIKKIGKGILNWSPLWIPIALFVWLVVANFVDRHCLNNNGIRTTAHVEKTYCITSRGGTHKMVRYYFYVGDSLYYGRTSPPDSVWNRLLPHVPFEIIYEKSNPNNSNWAGYYKDKQ